MLRVLAVFCFMLLSAHTVNNYPPIVKPDAVGSPQELASRMDCWQSGNHGMPSHVVYRLNGDWMIGGSKAVGMAFEQIFNGVDNDMTIHAFCK